MIEIAVYRGHELPEPHEHQIRSFIRIHWYDAYEHDLDEPLVPPDRQPLHVVAADRHALVAHARLSTVSFEHAGSAWRLCCLGDVFTYPAFRGRGLGSAVTAKATEHIGGASTADLAVLFCDPDHRDFYGRHGWVATPELRVTKGIGPDREPQEGMPMVLLLSERARVVRPDRTGQAWDLPGYGW